MSRIKKCPFCGKKPRQHQVDKSLISHDNGQGCILAWIGWTHIDEWNKLCVLVEKGHSYDMMKAARDLAHAGIKDASDQRDKAVRLLRAVIDLWTYPKRKPIYEAETFLASLDKKVGGK